MPAKKDLSKLIRQMQPVINPGEYIFTSVKNFDAIPKSEIVCAFKEAEGTTIIVKREIADQYNLSYKGSYSWITLNIHSSLEAVGFTATFSTELAKHGIGCNVIAGFYHDHIFVNNKDANRAIEVLRTISKNQTETSL